MLTSIKEDECLSIFGDVPDEKVFQFARMLRKNGADGVICAPREGLYLRSWQEFNGFKIATPNIRPLYSLTPAEKERTKDDQDPNRQMTPGDAMKAGIDMIVIGRPITNPPLEIGGPVEAAKLVADEIAAALR